MIVMFQSCDGYKAFWDVDNDSLSSSSLGFSVLGYIEPDVRRQLYADVELLYNPTLSTGSETDIYYSAIFGNTPLTAFGYFDDRVNYIGEYSDPADTVLAFNLGTGIWYQTFQDPSAANTNISGRRIVVSSTRTGLIAVNSARYGLFTGYSRLSILLHEARHSDCTGGLTGVQMAKLTLGDGSDLGTCGHSHTACPAGHTLAGQNACDDHLWGPYAIEYVFLKRAYAHCTTCTSQDLGLIELMMIDSFDKVAGNTTITDETAVPPNMSDSHTEP